jgi:lambda repressor-like predicted transcriptional regulator
VAGVTALPVDDRSALPVGDQPDLRLVSSWPSRGPGMGSLRFPVEPVRLLVEQRLHDRKVSLLECSRTLGLPLRTLVRVLGSETISWMVADRCAVAFGYHPCQLWPDWFTDTARNRG